MLTYLTERNHRFRNTANLEIVFGINFDYGCLVFSGNGKDGILSNICMYNFPHGFIQINCFR